MMQNIAFVYNIATIHHAYKKKREKLLFLMKSEKDKAAAKQIQTGLLLVDVSMQIFNDAQRQFPLINESLLYQNKEILVSKEEKYVDALKKSLEILGEANPLIFSEKMHHAIELMYGKYDKITSTIASELLKESAFLFTHMLYVLYTVNDRKKLFEDMDAFLHYLFGLNMIGDTHPTEKIFQEIMDQRKKEKKEILAKSDEENFVYNAYHYCLATLVFANNQTSSRIYQAEDAQKELNEKINSVLEQRKSTNIKGKK